MPKGNVAPDPESLQTVPESVKPEILVVDKGAAEGIGGVALGGAKEAGNVAPNRVVPRQTYGYGLFTEL